MGLYNPGKLFYLVFCGTNSRKKGHLSCSQRTSETDPDLRERLMYIAGKKEQANARCKNKEYDKNIKIISEIEMQEQGSKWDNGGKTETQK